MPPTKDTAATEAAKTGTTGAAPAAPAVDTSVLTAPTPTEQNSPEAQAQGFRGAADQANEQSTSGKGAGPVPVPLEDEIVPTMDPKRKDAKAHTVKVKKFFYGRAENGTIGSFKAGDTIYLTEEEAKRLQRAGHIN